MLILYHAPKSRSSRILTLIHEMGIEDFVTVTVVTIPRMDGSGGRDPRNPHPEGKVPALAHDGTLITESSAIILYLTALFPDAGLAPRPGSARYGAFVTWMCWYGSVMEPVMVLDAAGLAHPYLAATFRGPAEVTARIAAALNGQAWLMGDSYSAADLLIHSPYAWFAEATPDVPAIRDWVARCQARPGAVRTLATDAEALARAA